MNPRFQVSRGAIELIKRFEGYRQKAAQLPDGRWTIGHGHTLTARQGAEVSESDAEALLIYDLIAVAHHVNESVYTPLTQNQFDGLVCFAFNIGVDNFRRSAVLRRVNEGDLIKAAYEMELWRKSDFEGERILIDALVRRRAAEKTLFLRPSGGWLPVPSPVLPPKIDSDTTGLVPAANPVVLTTAMTGDHAVAEREGEAPPAAAPTATEAAASAVTAQLSQIMAEPAAEAAPEPAEPVVETPAEPVAEAPAEPVFDAPVEPVAQAPAEIEPAAEPQAVVEAEPAPEAQPEGEPAAEQPVAEQPAVEEAAPEAVTHSPLDVPPIPGAPNFIVSPPVAEEPAPLPTYAVIGDSDFALTPPAEDEAPAAPAEAAHEEPAVEAPAEPEPELFDPARNAQPEPAEEEPFRLAPARSLAEANPSPRILIDDTSFDPVETFDASYVDEAKPFDLRGIAPLLILGLVGLIFFGAGISLAFKTSSHGGLSVTTMLGYALGLGGIAAFAFATYQVLNRLVGDDDKEG